MAYTAEISRSNPTAILILLDQSSSMTDRFGGGTGTKADQAARIVNRYLTELTITCAKEEGIRDYFDVGILGYGRAVTSAFGQPLDTLDLHPISAIGENPIRLEAVTKKVNDGAGGLVEETVEIPVWVEPVANGMTPMCQAIRRTTDILQNWVANHPESYPPIVINVTDGEANDGNPLNDAAALRSVTTNDGAVLLFNCHISSSSSSKVHFPNSEEALQALNDPYAKQLYQMSSELPPAQYEAAIGEGFAVSSGARGFMFNADAVDLIQFFDIGTRVTSQMR